MKFLVRIIFAVGLNAVIFWVLDTKLFVENMSITGGHQGYVFIASVFGILNVLVRPLVNLVTLPLKILSLGIFSLIGNAFMLWLLQRSVNFLEMFGASLTIHEWSTYLFAGVILAFLNWILHILHK
jgi:putative membrane protein